MYGLSIYLISSRSRANYVSYCELWPTNFKVNIDQKLLEMRSQCKCIKGNECGRGIKPSGTEVLPRRVISAEGNHNCEAKSPFRAEQ